MSVLNGHSRSDVRRNRTPRHSASSGLWQALYQELVAGPYGLQLQARLKVVKHSEVCRCW